MLQAGRAEKNSDTPSQAFSQITLSHAGNLRNQAGADAVHLAWLMQILDRLIPVRSILQVVLGQLRLHYLPNTSIQSTKAVSVGENAGSGSIARIRGKHGSEAVGVQKGAPLEGP